MKSKPRGQGTGRRGPGWAGMAILAAGLAAVSGAMAAEAPDVQYGRDIRPILSDACFACHGPDAAQRKGDLRLDSKEDVLRQRDGYAVVVPGDAEISELVFRIETDEPTMQMPPPGSAKSLTPEQRELIRRWVADGADWQEHWAFVPPERPAPPAVKDTEWPRNTIDQFLLARLEAEGLKPSPEADRATLIRRVTLDLTGLPPTPEEVEAFLSDQAPDAYERLVDRLLDSPRYGEQMARSWLDLARYGDTHGLHLDNYREMWPYRDWVVQAFNRNLPFDQFATWQLAGDMLPDATLDQKIASGFNRAHVSTNEGGSIVEEVYVRNVTDRVDTTGTVFLGLTTACARCHDHKYDPFTAKEYYGLFAIFNSLDENPMDGNAAVWEPVVQVPTPEQEAERTRLDESLASIRAQIAEAVAQVPYDPAIDADEGEYVRREDFVWIDDALPPGSKPSAEAEWQFVTAPEHPVLAGSKATRRKAEGQSQHFFTDAAQALRIGEGDTLFAHVWLDPTDPPREVMLQWNTGTWSHRAYWGENLINYGKDGTPERLRIGDLPATGGWARLEVPVKRLGLKPGTQITGWAFTQHGGTVYYDRAGLSTWTPQPGQTQFESLAAYVRHLRAAVAAKVELDVPKDLLEIAGLDRAARSEEQARRLVSHFVEHAWTKTHDVVAPLRAELAKVQARRDKLEKEIPTTLVSKERAEPKPAFLLDRGEYDRPRDPVARMTPAFLPPPPDETPDRLDFARWLFTPEHPLTARVEVNRLWQRVFGTGIVKTAEDFGSQGEPPSHPELLDWLAVEFREGGWDVKDLLRQLVTSAAYRQSAHVRPELLARDPENRLLARGPRFRLDAETLRDQALFVGGLLVEDIGGPSVKPPQPPGLWEAVAYTSSNTAKFTADTGVEKVHRRSLYTFWKRTSPPPQLTTFDAPSRESCTARRERTNTPLQALLLMNEPQYVEAARALAERTLRTGGSSPEERAASMFRRVTGRAPEAPELAEMVAAYRDFHATYTADVEAAKRLIANGATTPDPALDPAELAAWTMVGNLVLNLDEVITRG